MLGEAGYKVEDGGWKVSGECGWCVRDAECRMLSAQCWMMVAGGR